MANTVTDILTDAYSVFECQPPQGLNVCTNCCMLPATELAMLSGPPSAITDEQLAEWGFAACENEVFPKAVCTFLAPRVMEAIFRPSDVIIEIDLSSRISFGNQALWNDAQSAVIKRFHHAYLEQYRCSTEVEPFLDDVFCMFSASQFHASDTLTIMDAWRDEDLINRLWLASAGWSTHGFWKSTSWDLYENWGPTEAKKHVAQDHQTVKSWYSSQTIKKRIDSYLATADPKTNTWSRAAEVEVALVKLRSAG